MPSNYTVPTSTSTLAGPVARFGMRRAGRAGASQLVTLAAATLWARGWESTVGGGVGDAVADLLCRKGSGRVALVVRPGVPDPGEAAALAGCFEREGVRSAWFCGMGFTPPEFARPTPVFGLATDGVGDSIAVLSGSRIALPFAGAVAALFDQRIQYRTHRLVAGPWLVELVATRLRCWRCGARQAAVEWRTARVDNHGVRVEAGTDDAARLAGRAMELVRFVDARGDVLETARLDGDAVVCRDCSAAFGPALVADIRRASAPLATHVVSVAHPPATIPGPHWCAADGAHSGGCCPADTIDADTASRIDGKASIVDVAVSLEAALQRFEDRDRDVLGGRP